MTSFVPEEVEAVRDAFYWARREYADTSVQAQRVIAALDKVREEARARRADPEPDYNSAMIRATGKRLLNAQFPAPPPSAIPSTSAQETAREIVEKYWHSTTRTYDAIASALTDAEQRGDAAGYERGARATRKADIIAVSTRGFHSDWPRHQRTTDDAVAALQALPLPADTGARP